MNTLNHKPAAAWQSYLAGLPAATPPVALRARTLAGFDAPSGRQRRWWRAGSLAAGILIALAGVGLWTHESGPGDPSVRQQANAGSGQLPVDSRVSQLDDVIARAYASDLSEPELQALWQARASLLVQHEEAPSALLVQL